MMECIKNTIFDKEGEIFSLIRCLEGDERTENVWKIKAPRVLGETSHIVKAVGGENMDELFIGQTQKLANYKRCNIKLRVWTFDPETTSHCSKEYREYEIEFDEESKWASIPNDDAFIASIGIGRPVLHVNEGD